MVLALFEDDGLPAFFLIAAAAGLLWLLLGLIGWQQRRSYNLTRSETAGSRAIQPDFLKIDPVRRAAALQAGERPPSEPPKLPPSPLLKWSGWVALLASVASFMAAAFGVLQRVEDYDKTVVRLTSGDGLPAMLQRYPAGFAIAAAIVLVQLALLIRRLMKRAAQ